MEEVLRQHEVSPKAHNELVGPQKPEEVVDESILQVLVPLERVAAVGIIGALLHLSSSAALHCTCSINSVTLRFASQHQVPCTQVSTAAMSPQASLVVEGFLFKPSQPLQPHSNWTVRG